MPRCSRRPAEWVWGLSAGSAILAALLGVARKDPPGSAVAFISPAARVHPAAANPAMPSADQGPFHGWLQVVGAGGIKDKVKLHAAHAALALGKGQTLYPGLPGTRATAAFAGEIALTKGGRYRFSILAQGGVGKLTVFGASGAAVGEARSTGTLAQTAWIVSDGSAVSVAVNFDRGGGAEAALRTYWERDGSGAAEGFVREPIPVSAVTVPKYAQRDAAAADAERRGRVLLGELNCVACHTPGPVGEGAIIRRRPPLLGEIGRRATPAWLRDWVRHPQAVKPGAGMPTVLGDSPQDDADAEAITHYLVSLGGPATWEPAATEPQTLSLGRAIYHTVGCVACHEALETPAKVFGDGSLPDTLPKAAPSAPYGKVRAKWRPAALAEFLREPLRTHPGGRMPSMALTEQEADLVAAYLVTLGQSGSDGASGFALDRAKVDVGRAAFSARGCASCHEIGHSQQEVPTRLASPALAALDVNKGCLDPQDARTPRYTLSAADRADLMAGIEAVERIAALGGKDPAPIDRAHRIVAALGCTSCHVKDEAGGPAADTAMYFRTVEETELGDEGRLPPRLTQVGWKLNHGWVNSMLTEAARSRPYMATRMPQFGGKQVGDLAGALAMESGVLPGTDFLEPRSTDEMVLAGRTLSGDKGLNCISCHAFNGKTGGTPGPDITGFAERLRYEWWKTYIMEPTRFKPGTRMSAFYREGKSAATAVYGGDPGRQTDALWAYLSTGRFGPAPEGLPSGAGLPLPLRDRPVIFRTFLKDAGSRGIAVGYPIGTHFGFDAGAVRLVDAWQGDFVDASSAWKGRGGMVASGQGGTVWAAPPGPAVVIGARPEKWPLESGPESGYAFKGYRLDEKGVPTFLYEVRGVRISERFEPGGDVLIRRRFEVRGLAAAQGAWIAIGPKATAIIEGQGPTEIVQVGGTPCIALDTDGAVIVNVSK